MPLIVALLLGAHITPDKPVPVPILSDECLNTFHDACPKGVVDIRCDCPCHSGSQDPNRGDYR